MAALGRYGGISHLRPSSLTAIGHRRRPSRLAADAARRPKKQRSVIERHRTSGPNRREILKTVRCGQPWRVGMAAPSNAPNIAAQRGRLSAVL